MLQIKHFTKEYTKGIKAVDDLSLTIEDGDIFAIVGHNGSGKTTTLKSVVGILEFNSGDILINGTSIKENPIKCKEQISYLPDNPDLYEHLKGIEYINFICDIYKVKNRTEKIKKYAKLFEIEEFLGNSISTYSHGMKQKIAIISVLVHDPKIIIMDEPFVGLDPISTLNLKNIMKELTKEKVSIFFSTHVLDVAEKLCNKVAIINKGKLVLTGNMKELVKNKSLEDIFMEQINE